LGILIMLEMKNTFLDIFEMLFMAIEQRPSTFVEFKGFI